MKTYHSSFAVPTLIAIGLGILAAALVLGVLSGRKIPMISGDRAALLVTRLGAKE